MKCMEKEWDTYSIVVEDPNGTFPILRSGIIPGIVTVDVGSACFEDVENWIRYYWPGEWRKVYDHFAAAIKLGVCEDGGRFKIQPICDNTYIITMEKKAKRKQERACAKCKHHFEGWDIDVGSCQMCRRLQSEEYDLVYGGTRFVGPLLECGEERGIKKGARKRLWRGRDICGKDGRYWVEK